MGMAVKAAVRVPDDQRWSGTRRQPGSLPAATQFLQAFELFRSQHLLQVLPLDGFQLGDLLLEFVHLALVAGSEAIDLLDLVVAQAELPVVGRQLAANLDRL